MDDTVDDPKNDRGSTLEDDSIGIVVLIMKNLNDMHLIN